MTMSSLSVVAFVFFLGNFVFPLDPVQAITFSHLGCYKDFWKTRALPDFLATFPKLHASKQCADLARKAGYSTFAVQDGGLCFSGISADHTYDMYGPANNCRGGVGGSWANDVYQIPLYILLKKMRENYTNRLQNKTNLQDRKFESLRNKTILHDKELESLRQRYQSLANKKRLLTVKTNSQARKLSGLRQQIQYLSNKERSLQNRLSALNGRVSRARVSCNTRYTSWQPSSSAPIMFLDRHHINCPHGQFVASFRLKRSADQNSAPVRYVYQCCRFIL